MTLHPKSGNVFTAVALILVIAAACVLQYYAHRPAHADTWGSAECKTLQKAWWDAVDACHQPYRDWQNAKSDVKTAMLAVCTGAFVTAMILASKLPDKTAREKAEWAANSALAVCIGGITTVLINNAPKVKRAEEKFDAALAKAEKAERKYDKCQEGHNDKYHRGKNPPGHSSSG